MKILCIYDTQVKWQSYRFIRLVDLLSYLGLSDRWRGCVSERSAGAAFAADKPAAFAGRMWHNLTMVKYRTSIKLNALYIMRNACVKYPYGSPIRGDHEGDQNEVIWVKCLEYYPCGITSGSPICGNVCTGLVIIWYAINHTTCTDQKQSQNMRWSKAIIRSICVPHSTLFIFILWSHKNKSGKTQSINFW